jgi:hypothetical protein
MPPTGITKRGIKGSIGVAMTAMTVFRPRELKCLTALMDGHPFPKKASAENADFPTMDEWLQ